MYPAVIEFPSGMIRKGFFTAACTTLISKRHIVPNTINAIRDIANLLRLISNMSFFVIVKNNFQYQRYAVDANGSIFLILSYFELEFHQS